MPEEFPETDAPVNKAPAMSDTHDLKNLLSAVVGYADLALDDLGPGHPARESVEKAMSTARAAAARVDAMIAGEAVVRAGRAPGGAAAGDVPSVLVVDDERMMREVLCGYLSRAGYRVAAVENGRSAIAEVSRARPDLVITDIVMPEQEGIQTILELRKIAPTLPVIAVSGGGPDHSAYDTYLSAARNLGADRVFRKPVDRATILAAVAELAGPAQGPAIIR